MSETPRTDEWAQWVASACNETVCVVPAEFARTLERENARLRAEVAELHGRDEWWVAWAKRQQNESGVMMAIVERDARVAAVVRATRAESECAALRRLLREAPGWFPHDSPTCDCGACRCEKRIRAALAAHKEYGP